MNERPIGIADIPSLRLSVASTKRLPPDQIERLLTELERLLRQRDELVLLLDQLRSGPWPETRRLLAELQRALHHD
jgi:hypothetical protein